MQFGRREAPGGPEGPAALPEETAERERALARLLDAGLHEEAAELMRALLRDYERHLGFRHATTVSLYDALGHVLYRLRRLPEAEAMHREAYQRSTVVDGPAHPRTLGYAHNLGAALVIGAEPTQGITLLTTTLEHREAVLGAGHPDTLDTAAVLGAVLFSTGEHERGAALLESTWKHYADTLGPEHVQTLAAGGNLAAARHTMGRTDEAARLLAELHDGCARALGPEHELTRQTRAALDAVGPPSGR
ncbi:tetratricopeptide repeat protein [Streptomyces marincola]|nr:tetratricopeptide repeat protein [Streptomyces marincola]